VNIVKISSGKLGCTVNPTGLIAITGIAGYSTLLTRFIRNARCTGLPLMQGRSWYKNTLILSMF